MYKYSLIFILSLIFSACTKVNYDENRPRIYQNPVVKNVAVLGFNNTNLDRAITEKLVNSSEWHVLSTSTVKKALQQQGITYNGYQGQSVIDIGKRLKVDAVIFGKIKNNTLHINAVNPKTSKYLAKKSFPLYAKDTNWVSAQAATAILPSTTRYEDDIPTKIWLGPNGDNYLHQ